MREIDALNERFHHSSPQEVLRWCLSSLGTEAALAWGGGESVAILDMMWRIDPEAVRVFLLDTGRLPRETHDLIRDVQCRYGVSIEIEKPRSDLVAEMVRQRGENLFYDSIESRKYCCRVRKLEPLNRVLSSLKGWVTGRRRSEGGERSGIQKFEREARNGGLIRINPLADWPTSRVFDYIRQYDVPMNALHNQGYPSIGCAPCTRPVAAGESERRGRWWWESRPDRECGMFCKTKATFPESTSTNLESTG